MRSVLCMHVYLYLFAVHMPVYACARMHICQWHTAIWLKCNRIATVLASPTKKTQQPSHLLSLAVPGENLWLACLPLLPLPLLAFESVLLCCKTVRFTGYEPNATVGRSTGVHDP